MIITNKKGLKSRNQDILFTSSEQSNANMNAFDPYNRKQEPSDELREIGKS